MAADNNHPEGMSNLGTMYLQGRGVQQDFQQALLLLRKAAEQGYAVAQNNLALMYANGQGTERDYVQAYSWLDLAADRNSAAGQLRDRIGEQMTDSQRETACVLAQTKREEIARKVVRPK